MLKTQYEGELFLHRLAWEIAEEQARLASEWKQGWSRPGLVAMIFAFHTVEAYMNLVGIKIAPYIWEDEENFFRKEPYRGWKGKLRKIMELVNLPWTEKERPLKTVLELKELRDRIAHGKPENLSREMLHPDGSEPPVLVSDLWSMFTPKEKIAWAMDDAERLINQIHAIAATKMNDPWLGHDALRGATWHTSGTTTVHPG